MPTLEEEIANEHILLSLEEEKLKNKVVRPSWQDVYMQIAKLISKRSKDPHTKVGACLVKNGCVIGVGYNGQPRNFKGSFDWSTSEKYDYVIHAEMNAILNATSLNISCNGAEIYLTHSPCSKCMLMLAQANIKKVYYLEEYKDFDFSKKIAENTGIELHKYVFTFE